MGTSTRGLPVPYWYALESLAQRWHTTPYELEARLGEPLVQTWVLRGLLFMRLEAVEVRRGH